MLNDLRVLDLSSEIAGPYGTKLLADAGADVVKAEAPEGDPLRGWRDGDLFRFLNTSKRSVVGDGLDLLDGADVVIEDRGAGPELASRNPRAVVVSITPFGLTGPWADRPATEFTLQGWCGSTGGRGIPERPPVYAGGRLGEWIGGAYAALAAVAAWRSARTTGRGELIDLSLLECMSVTMNTYASVFASFMGWRPAPGPARTIEIPSIEPTADGYVGFCTITAQQFQDFLVLIERPDLLDDQDLATAMGRSRRMHEVLKLIHDWTTRHTTADIIEKATLLRIPVAPIGNGETVTTFEHFVARGTFVDHPGGRFRQPRVPYGIADDEPRPFAPAPEVGEHTGQVQWPTREDVPGDEATPPALPLAGIRVLDFTAFWAGPAATHMLAALGADVIKVESTTRPDGMRFSATRPPSVDGWWEWGPIFHAANANKRGITLDLTKPEAVDLAKRLIAVSDAVVENFSPRVMEQFGLGWEGVSAANPRVVMVRMPAFGLDGPWRDRTGFAQTMEQVSGLAWVTGFADGPPLIPRGACDPFAGMHAALALLVALDRRDRVGEGALVEITMVEAALNAAAEQVIEATGHGELLGRDGNRGTVAAPQGVYPAAGDEEWLALAVATDEQWDALRTVVDGLPDLPSAEARRAAHDELDEHLATWCAQQEVEAAVEQLAAAGVPAAVAVAPRDIAFNEQFRARRFLEPVEHPVVGVHEIPGVPFRFAHGPDRWLRTPAPTIGQHNDEVLGGLLGLDAGELARLRADGVIGERPSRL